LLDVLLGLIYHPPDEFKKSGKRIMATVLKLTVHHLEALPDDGNRYELIDGELLVSKAPGLIHQEALGRLFYCLANFLMTSPIGRVILNPGIVFDDYNGVIPDLVYVSSERAYILTPRGLIAAPDLIAEIVSPGEKNSEHDRQVKRQLYSVRGVREYWVVDPELHSIEVYRQQENALVLAVTLYPGDLLTSPLLPGFSCPVAEIFA
jgi:Uma2 family endonuclease